MKISTNSFITKESLILILKYLPKYFQLEYIGRRNDLQIIFACAISQSSTFRVGAQLQLRCISAFRSNVDISQRRAHSYRIKSATIYQRKSRVLLFISQLQITQHTAILCYQAVSVYSYIYFRIRICYLQVYLIFVARV